MSLLGTVLCGSDLPEGTVGSCSFVRSRFTFWSNQIQQWPGKVGDLNNNCSCSLWTSAASLKGLRRLLAAPPFQIAVMTTHTCFLIYMRSKGFKCFFCVADLALATVPYTAIAVTGGSSSQKRPAPTIHMPEATKNFMFMLRTLSWLPGNCRIRYKLQTAVNRKWPLTISALTLPEAELIATEAGPSHLQYIPPTPSLLQMHLRADLASGNKSYKTLSSEQALQQNMKS